ncbi:hypothetical protein Acsp03_71760 [Actinomadura sp. NBRC 104412]|uniref:hypothetical protein n=1 Tax=Actinomadura sp. NBRC 104412 TaxID=3032203 RepID=UPI0024A4EDC8|nr:hypothetical protein [Actinomadura sp. NBRC 104412]GLZ09710.1 hypothetical protein Acsp03_71760 [Actinomadura sp. NBRC 104412]
MQIDTAYGSRDGESEDRAYRQEGDTAGYRHRTPPFGELKCVIQVVMSMTELLDEP